MSIEQKNGEVIFLFLPKMGFEDKKGSEFIYDEKLRMWCLKWIYDETDIENANLSGLPMLHPSELNGFGIWMPIKF